MSEITQDEKKIKIAKYLGWTVQFSETKQLHELRTPSGAWEHPYDADGSEHHCWSYAPDFFNDLNACHEMEETLDDNQWDSYVCALLNEMPRSANQPDRDKDPAHATAPQRAEAFGISLALW